MDFLPLTVFFITFYGIFDESVQPKSVIKYSLLPLIQFEVNTQYAVRFDVHANVLINNSRVIIKVWPRVGGRLHSVEYFYLFMKRKVYSPFSLPFSALIYEPRRHAAHNQLDTFFLGLFYLGSFNARENLNLQLPSPLTTALTRDK